MVYKHIPYQGFSYLSEVGANGLLNLGKKAFGSSKLGKFDGLKMNLAAISNGLKSI